MSQPKGDRGHMMAKCNVVFGEDPGEYRASLLAQRLKCLPAIWETWVWSLGWEDPWRRKWQPTPGFLPGESNGQRSLVGYGPWGCKESDTTERLHSHFHSQVDATGPSQTQWLMLPPGPRPCKVHVNLGSLWMKPGTVMHKWQPKPLILVTWSEPTCSFLGPSLLYQATWILVYEAAKHRRVAWWGRWLTGAPLHPTQLAGLCRPQAVAQLQGGPCLVLHVSPNCFFKAP